MYDILLMVHFLSLGAGLGISLTMFVLGLQAGKISPAEFGPMMGRIGLAMKNVAIAGITLVSSPDYLTELTQSTVGQLMLLFGAVTMVIGIFWIRRIIRIEA